jgi:hypothetical protein
VLWTLAIRLRTDIDLTDNTASAISKVGRRQLAGEGAACDSVLSDTDNGVGYGVENAEDNTAALLGGTSSGTTTTTKNGGSAVSPPSPKERPKHKRQGDKIANGLANVLSATNLGPVVDTLMTTLMVRSPAPRLLLALKVAAQKNRLSKVSVRLFPGSSARAIRLPTDLPISFQLLARMILLRWRKATVILSMASSPPMLQTLVLKLVLTRNPLSRILAARFPSDGVSY